MHGYQKFVFLTQSRLFSNFSFNKRLLFLSILAVCHMKSFEPGPFLRWGEFTVLRDWQNFRRFWDHFLSFNSAPSVRFLPMVRPPIRRPFKITGIHPFLKVILLTPNFVHLILCAEKKSYCLLFCIEVVWCSEWEVSLSEMDSWQLVF